MGCYPLPNWLHKRRQLSPHRTALIFEDRSWSFAELDDAAQIMASRLAGWGVKQGTFVALLTRNSMPAVEIIHALEYLGAVMVMLNIRLSSHELSWQLADSQANCLIYDDELAALAADLIQKHPRIMGRGIKQLPTLPKKNVLLKYAFDPEALHTIIYTSGTEGRPKGVMLSYANHWWSAMGSALNLGFTAQDTWLLCLPIFHVGGLSILIRSAIYGIAVDLLPSFTPDLLNQRLDQNPVTMISLVSSMLDRLIEQRHGRPLPANLRCILLGGGPVSPMLLDRCRTENIPVFQTYGMTETASQIATISPEELFIKTGSAGRALYFSEVKIIAEGRELPSGQPGEIAVRGPNVTKGYFKNPEATGKVIINGWLHTGDMGYLDKDGCLFLLDRRNDLIISGGENIYPAEIEALLMSHPAVSDAGVTGQADDKWGMVPVAFVQLKEGESTSPEMLTAYCRERLAKYKLPKAFYIVDKLPRNASHKLLRRELLQLIPDLNQKEPVK